MLDADGYPTDETLKRITEWPYSDFVGLMKFVREAWAYADAGYWDQTDTGYSISTAGWSGNEDIIGALRANKMFWLCCWEESRRGGHYKFDLSRLPSPTGETGGKK